MTIKERIYSLKRESEYRILGADEMQLLHELEEEQTALERAEEERKNSFHPDSVTDIVLQDKDVPTLSYSLDVAVQELDKLAIIAAQRQFTESEVNLLSRLNQFFVQYEENLHHVQTSGKQAD